MKIGEIAKQSGVPASAIRYYESIGLLPKSGRQSGRRVFKSDTLAYLSIIGAAKNLGFSIGEIKVLINGLSIQDSRAQRWRTIAQKKISDIEERIKHAKQIKRILEEALHCHCLDINACAKSLTQGIRPTKCKS